MKRKNTHTRAEANKKKVYGEQIKKKENPLRKEKFYRSFIFSIWEIKSILGLEFRSAIRNKIDSHARFYYFERTGKQMVAIE